MTAADGRWDHDIIGLDGEDTAGGAPLLSQVMVGGRRSTPPEPLEMPRERVRRSIATLPSALRDVCAPVGSDRVFLSDGMEALIDRLRQSST